MRNFLEPHTEHLRLGSNGHPFVSLWQTQHFHIFYQSFMFARKWNQWQRKGQIEMHYNWQNFLSSRRQLVLSLAESSWSTVHSHSKENSAPSAVLAPTGKSVK